MIKEVLKMNAVCKDLIVVNDAAGSIKWRFATEDNHRVSVVSNIKLIKFLLHCVYKMHYVLILDEVFVT